ncbi:MAG: GTP-binding protein [Ardenticatenaceae bacterium]
MNHTYRINDRVQTEWAAPVSIWQRFKSYVLQWLHERLTPQPLVSVVDPHRYIDHVLACHQELQGVFVPGCVSPMLADLFVAPHLVGSPHGSADSSEQLGSSTNVELGIKGVWEFLDSHQALWIVGSAGSGKTTLLKHMTITLGERYQEASEQLPILLLLRHHSQAIHKNPNYTLGEALQQGVMISQMVDPPSPDWFSEQLKKGECLVMLDGLDEVPQEQRQGVVAWIEQQMGHYGNNSFVITSRPLDDYRLDGVRRLEMQPFTSQQVEELVKSWYFVQERDTSQDEWGACMKAEKKTEALISLISEPAQKTLAANPLLLTMMVTSCELQSTISPSGGASSASPPRLPSSRVELYGQVCNLLLNRPNPSASGTPEFALSGAQKERVLQSLAYHMMEHKQCAIEMSEAKQVLYVPLDIVSGTPHVAEFLYMIEDQSGLLHKNGEYAFAHRSFQEYFASRHLLTRRLERKIIHRSRLEDSWWHETIRLYCTGVDATPLIAACLRDQNPALPMLRLAIACMEEVSELKPDVQKRLQSILEQGVEEVNPLRRRLAAEGLLSLRLKGMIAVNESLYVADSLISNAEYQLFIDEQQARHPLPLEPTSSSEAPFPPGTGLLPVAGIAASDAVAFCQWLTERDKQKRDYRLPYIGEFEPLLSEFAYWGWCRKEQIHKLENNKATGQMPLTALEKRLNSALAHDLAYNPQFATEPILAFARDLEQVSEQTRAITLACQFSHDRAHHCAINLAAHSNGQGQKVPSAIPQLAHLVTERLLRVLRTDSATPDSLIELSGRRNKSIHTSISTSNLAEAYFGLYADFQRFQKRTDDESSTSGRIRIVADRPVVPPPTGRAQKGATKRKQKEIFGRKSKSRPTDHDLNGSDATRVIQKKICLLGDANVGKTSLIRRFVEERFDERYLSTVGVNISRKTLVRPSETINMLLWEIEGSDGFKKKHLNFLHGVTGAIIVCDLTRHKTLDTLERYARQLRALNATVPLVFIGNKVDLLNKRTITDRELRALCNKLGGPYLLTSAKTGTQVNDAFSLLADQIEGAQF